MEDELSATCEKLDELLDEFLVEWSKYRILMTSFSTSMKDGFLSVSKARYSMGVNAVSELQVPDDEFQPLVEVRPIQDDYEEKAHSGLYFEFLRLLPSKQSKSQRLKDVPTEDGNVVRRRLVSGKDSALVDKEISEKKEADSKKALVADKVQVSSDVRPDPLHWFGVLVPTSLKQGQSCFQNAIRNSVELANLKMKLDKIIDEYMLLKENKYKQLKAVDTISSNSGTR